MRSRHVLLAVLFVLIICRPVAAERVDDLTVIQNGALVMKPLVQPEYPGPTQDRLERRGMNDGYAFCSDSNNTFPFDLTTHVPGTGIAGYDYPYDAMMNPQGTEVWVADASIEGVVVLDRATDTVTHTIPIGGYTTGIAFSGDGSFALAADRDSDLISKINATTYAVESSITDVTGESWGPGFITYCPGNDRFYASQWYGDRLFEISSDGTQVLRDIPLGTSLWQLVCSHDGSMLYVLDRGNDVVRFVDVETFAPVTAVAVGDDPWGVDITPNDSLLVIGCEDSHQLFVCTISPPGATAISLATTNDPRDVDISVDGVYAYIPAGPDLDHVLILDIDAMTVSGSIAPPGAATTNSVSVAPQMGPVSATIDLTGDVVGGTLHLVWTTSVEVSAYWVYGASNLPWFAPGFAPGYNHRVAVLPPATTTWSSASGVGDPEVNWTWMILAVDGLEQELARSNRVGEHDFGADIP